MVGQSGAGIKETYSASSCYINKPKVYYLQKTTFSRGKCEHPLHRFVSLWQTDLQ